MWATFGPKSIDLGKLNMVGDCPIGTIFFRARVLPRRLPTHVAPSLPSLANFGPFKPCRPKRSIQSANVRVTRSHRNQNCGCHFFDQCPKGGASMTDVATRGCHIKVGDHHQRHTIVGRAPPARRRTIPWIIPGSLLRLRRAEPVDQRHGDCKGRDVDSQKQHAWMRNADRIADAF